jgi:hypothetical protein
MADGKLPSATIGPTREIELQPKVDPSVGGQRAVSRALVYPARILQKKRLFRFQDWD